MLDRKSKVKRLLPKSSGIQHDGEPSKCYSMCFMEKGGMIDYKHLDYPSQVALALAYSEGMVSHERLKQLTAKHSADLSQTLLQLVEKQILRKTGQSRGSVYHLIGLPPPLNPDDVFGLESNSTNLGQNSTNLREKTLSKVVRDRDGCINSEHLKFPIVDRFNELSGDLRQKLEHLANEAREKGSISQEKMEKILIDVCSHRYMSLAALTQLLNRSASTLRGVYLSRMVKEKKLQTAFPAKPNDPRQAYITTESSRSGDGNGR